MAARSRRNDDPAVVEAELRPVAEFKADLAFLAVEYDRLLAQFPDQWVAIYDRQVVAKAAELDELLRNVEDEGVSSGSTVVEFLNSVPQLHSH